ncbi:Uncharacterised protein [Mycobacteroides abscessus subsp. abscessus]|nr:Uncharacterised protein [Mycobacteroides abscessus subsp. abscessus]
MEVELAYGDSVGPGSPLGRVPTSDAEDMGAGYGRMCLRLAARHRDGTADNRGGADGGVVDDPVDHHRRGVGGNGDGVGSDFGDLPGEVLVAGKCFGAAAGAYGVNGHDPHITHGSLRSKGHVNVYFCILSSRILQTLQTRLGLSSSHVQTVRRCAAAEVA